MSSNTINKPLKQVEYKDPKPPGRSQSLLYLDSGSRTPVSDMKSPVSHKIPQISFESDQSVNRNPPKHNAVCFTDYIL